MYPYMSKPLADKNIDIPDTILRQLLTPSEIRMLKNRWQILNLLQEGNTIRQIAEQVKVGTDTVVRVSKMMVTGELRKLAKERKIKTPWIFGKSE
jgi:uncharacterized protein YerC